MMKQICSILAAVAVTLARGTPAHAQSSSAGAARSVGATKLKNLNQIPGFVLLVIVGDYNGTGNRPGTTDMANKLSRAFALAGFAPDKISALYDEAGRPDRAPAPTLDNIERALRWIAHEATPGDSVVVVLAGHGRFDAQGKLCLGNGDVLGVEEVHDALSQSKMTNLLLIVDTCRVFGDQYRLAPCIHPSPETRNCLALYSCSPGELSFGHMFLENVAGGLEGAADQDKNGQVTVADLFEYARARTAQTGLENPIMEVRRGSANVLVARVAPKIPERRVTISRLQAGPACPHGHSYVDFQVDGQIPDTRASLVYAAIYLRHDDDERSPHRTASGDQAKAGAWMSLGPKGRFSGTIRIPCSTLNNPHEDERLLANAVVWDRPLVRPPFAVEVRRPKALVESPFYGMPRPSAKRPPVSRMAQRQ